MTTEAVVDGFRLTVPAGWWVWKYDDSSFHRNQFQRFAGGSKAVDAVVLSDQGELWWVEVKDYRRHRRSKPGSVFAETASKVRATLAGLATARTNANDANERQLALQAMQCGRVRVVLQLMQSAQPSRLFPQLVDPMDATLALRRVARAVDAHAICAAEHMNDPRLPWHTAAV